MIKLFVATCMYNVQAEIVLEYSVRKHCSEPVEIHWMRNAPGHEQFVGWNQKGWGTNFTPFRWIVPNLCNFEGKAIYVDIDVVVLDDLKKLWDYPIEDTPHYILSLPDPQYSVMLMDCSKFKDLDCVATIEEFKERSCNPPYKGIVNDYVTALNKEPHLIAPLDPKWNCLDGENYPPEKASIIHYTRKETQPWAPYSFRMEYYPHDNDVAKKIWYDYYTEAMEEFYKNPSHKNLF